MLISNAKLYYLSKEEWTEIKNNFLDVTMVNTASRANSKKLGSFINHTFDNIEINIDRGNYSELDSLKPRDIMKLRVDDGMAYYSGNFYVDDKNTNKNTNKSTIFFCLNPDEEITVTPKTTGAKSGVQDVQIEGRSIVDEDTGIANITTLTTKSEFETATEKVTEALTSLENYCDALDATKLDTISYIELSGTKGTLTDEQRATLLSGSPTLNFIDKDGMLFKCVFYSSGKKAVYSIAGESKIHVITVTLPAGTWALVTYNLQPTLTAGDGITIKNNVISATGGGTGGASQEYVDTQDQAVLKTCRDELAGETLARTNADNAMQASITVLEDVKANKAYVDQRDEAYATRIDEKLAHETTERQEADQQFASAIEELGNTKENTLVAGTNIEIDRDTQPGKTIIKAINGGSGVSQEYVDEHDASTLTSAKAYTDEKVLVVSQALDTVATNLEQEKTDRRTTDNEIKEDLITETTNRTNGDTQTLNDAKAYTDEKIGNIETVLETLTTGSGAN